jgi:hypothetical protein
MAQLVERVDDDDRERRRDNGSGDWMHLQER